MLHLRVSWFSFLICVLWTCHLLVLTYLSKIPLCLSATLQSRKYNIYSLFPFLSPLQHVCMYVIYVHRGWHQMSSSILFHFLIYWTRVSSYTQSSLIWLTHPRGISTSPPKRWGHMRLCGCQESEFQCLPSKHFIHEAISIVSLSLVSYEKIPEQSIYSN